MGTEGRRRVLTLLEPWFGLTELNDVRQVRWLLADDDGNGFLVSWVERAFDTGMPECMAFPASVWNGEPDEVDWGHVAVSHEPDAAKALEDVLWQIKRLYGVGLVEHGALALCRPGEVVADG